LTIKLIGSDKQLLGSDGFVVFGFLPLEFFSFHSYDRLTMSDGRLWLKEIHEEISG
jgi:hypothetical protein